MRVRTVAVAMRMIVVVMGMIMIVKRMVVGVEKIRLQFQDAIEIEGIALQYCIKRHCRFHGAMHGGVGVDAANAGLDLRQLLFGRKIGLVEDDDIGKSDL